MPELLIFLKKSETVTLHNVEEIYVHQINDDGTIDELIAIDRKDKATLESNPERPTVRRRRAPRMSQPAATIGDLYAMPGAKDRDDVDVDIIPWPAHTGGMYEDYYYDSDDGEDLMNKVTEILGKYNAMRTKPRATGTPITEYIYTAHPAVVQME